VRSGAERQVLKAKIECLYSCNGIHALTNSHEDTSAFCFHLTNAVIDDSWPGVIEGFEVFNSSAKRERQSGWRLKFPENLFTVPDIG
jgi:hypothetical protein